MAGIGLVLGAGGAVGRGYHAGTLAGLAEATGWDPRDATIVVGTSAGASVAALVRAGVPAGDIAAHAVGEPLSPPTRERFGDLPPPPPEPRLPRPSRRHLFLPAAPRLLLRAVAEPLRFPPGVLAAAGLPPGECSTEGIGSVVRPLFGHGWANRELWICAVSLDAGERIVFGSERAPPVDVATAVEASSAAPTFFAPVEIGGVRYVDGSAHSPTNLDLLRGLGLDLVIVVSPLSAMPNARLTSITGLMRSFASLTLEREAATVRTSGTDVVAFEPTGNDLAAMGVNPMDARRRAPATRAARQSALRRLEDPSMQERLALLRHGG